DLRIGEVRSAVLATGRTQGRDKPGGDDRLVPRAEAQLDAVGGGLTVLSSLCVGVARQASVAAGAFVQQRQDLLVGEQPRDLTGDGRCVSRAHRCETSSYARSLRGRHGFSFDGLIPSPLPPSTASRVQGKGYDSAESILPPLSTTACDGTAPAAAVLVSRHVIGSRSL